MPKKTEFDDKILPAKEGFTEGIEDRPRRISIPADTSVPSDSFASGIQDRPQRQIFDDKTKEETSFSPDSIRDKPTHQVVIPNPPIKELEIEQPKDEPNKFHSIPLNGKLRTSVDPSTVAEGDFVTLSNMRYGLVTPKSVSGMTQINTTALSAAGYGNMPFVRAMYHFRKSLPAESHLLVQGGSTAGLANSKLFDNSTTAIPDQGNFSTTALIDETSLTGVVPAKMSDAPDSCMAYCNGVNSYVWGGNEYRCAGFVVGNPAGTNNLFDYTGRINNTLQDANNVAILNLGTGGYVYVASTRPLQGIKFYVSTVNTAAVTLTEAAYWTAGAWTACANVSDGTVAAGKTLAQTGSVSFDSTVGLAKITTINNIFAYWYRFNWTGIDATTAVYYVTLYAPIQPMVDIWDGVLRPIASFIKYDASRYIDETTNVFKEDYYKIYGDPAANLTWASLGTIGASDFLYCGFTERMMAIDFKMVTNQENNNTATASVSYWSGTAWTAVTGLVDGTLESGDTLGKHGTMSWEAPAESAEAQTTLATGSRRYWYYRVGVSAGLSATTKVDAITGIPAPKTIRPYAVPVLWQNRIWLLNDLSSKKNSAICSAVDTVCVFNGEDAISPDAPMSLGDDDALVAGATIFTRFGDKAYDSLILLKAGEVWLIDGTKPEDYVKYKISDNYGCIAAATLKSCDMGYEISPGINKHVLIWLAQNGVMSFDGNSISVISQDIEDKFDPAHANFLGITVMSAAQALYDPTRYEYHLFFSTQEWVYSLRKKGWFLIDRGTGKYIQSGCDVRDTSGRDYIYGAIDTGYVERLEDGTTFDGTAIVSAFRTGELAFDGWDIQTSISRIRHYAVAKTTTTNTVSMLHYGDTSTSSDSNTFSVTASGKRMALINASVQWGNNIFHSFQCSMTTNNEKIGYEPISLSVMYKPIHEDIL